jgi:hypothetical protein
VVVLTALGFALYLRAKAPPEAALLLPESDAIVYVHLKDIREFTHFDKTPVPRSPELQQFIAATGIVPERDIDAAAFALHRVVSPAPALSTRHGRPAADLFVSEVFIGRFDGQRLKDYLQSVASSTENYAGREVYSIPLRTQDDPAGQTLRVAQLAYDTIAASNMPTSEQIHSMLDRSRASALGTPGSSLLAARFHDVPLLSQAWAIGHIGLPFSQNGYITVLGLQLPLPEDADFVASLGYSETVHLGTGGGVHLRIEEFAPDEATAHNTVQTLTSLLGVVRGIDGAEPPKTPPDAALRAVLNSITLAQHKDRDVLDATATVEQLKALTAAHDPAAAGASAPATVPQETSPTAPASK